MRSRSGWISLPLREQPIHLAVNLLHPLIQRGELIVAFADEDARDGRSEDSDDANTDHHQNRRDDASLVAPVAFSPEFRADES